MVNFGESTLNTAAPAGVAETAEAGGAQAAAAMAAVVADSVAPAQAALVASAYVSYGSANRLLNSAQRLAAQDTEDEPSSATADSHLAALRAVLPAAVQPQFDAQLSAATYGGPPGGDLAAEEGKAQLSESDLARLVSGNPGEDDGLGLLVSRLAHAVARHGAAPIVQALRESHERMLFAAPGGPPARMSADVRSAGRADEREREREQQRRALRRRPDPKSDHAAERNDDAGPTINDVLSYRGFIVASSTTPMPFPDVERNPL